MKQITTREKISLSIGALVAVAIFVYFIFWPMLQGEQSGPMSGLEETQAELELIRRFEGMEPLLVGLEKRMRSRSGYEEMSFRPGIADSTIIKYLAEAAKQAGINDLEQLDAKPDTSRKTQTETGSDQAALRSVVDQMYLVQAMDEAKQEADSNDEGAVENDAGTEGHGGEENSQSSSSSVPEPASDVPEGQEPESPNSEQASEKLEQRGNTGASAPVEQGSETPSELTEDMDGENPPYPFAQAFPKLERIRPEFPLLPRGKDIPDEVTQSLAEFIEASQGKTIGSADISRILREAGVEDEKEKERMRKRIQLYGDGVKGKKGEMLQWLSKLGVLQNAAVGQKAGKFSVKMVFKTQMDQLVKLLYNLQNSAKWLRIESMRVSVSDRKETLLSVELSMTATTMYD